VCLARPPVQPGAGDLTPGFLQLVRGVLQDPADGASAGGSRCAVGARLDQVPQARLPGMAPGHEQFRQPGVDQVGDLVRCGAALPGPVVAVLIWMADPTPGVSANSNPSRKISAGISTWTDATCSSARRVLACATKPATSANGTSTGRGDARGCTIARGQLPKPDRRDHRGHRQRPHRQVGAAEQRVHQRGLAPAELAHHGELNRPAASRASSSLARFSA
jgi:hypothetical protein